MEVWFSLFERYFLAFHVVLERLFWDENEFISPWIPHILQLFVWTRNWNPLGFQKAFQRNQMRGFHIKSAIHLAMTLQTFKITRNKCSQLWRLMWTPKNAVEITAIKRKSLYMTDHEMEIIWDNGGFIIWLKRRETDKIYTSHCSWPFCVL